MRKRASSMNLDIIRKLIMRLSLKHSRKGRAIEEYI